MFDPHQPHAEIKALGLKLSQLLHNETEFFPTAYKVAAVNHGGRLLNYICSILWTTASHLFIGF